MTFAHQSDLDFNLGAVVDNPVGVAADDTYIYVWDRTDKRLYVYNKAGVRQQARELSIAGLSVNAIDVDDTYLYVNTGGLNASLRVYNKVGGQRQESREFDFTSTINAHALAIDGTNAYITDISTNRLYAFALADGSRQESLEFAFRDAPTLGSSWAWIPYLALDDTYFYGLRERNTVVDQVEVYTRAGVFQSDQTIDVGTGALSSPTGITKDGDRLLVLQRIAGPQHVIQVYTQPVGTQVRLGGLTVLAAPTAKLPDPSATIRMGGVSIDAALRLGRPAQVAAETRLGGLAITAEPTVGIPPPARFATPFVHVPADQFSIDRTVIEEPDSMAGEGDRLYILDWLNRRVTVYLTDGTRQSSQDFTLDDAHRLPRSITVVEGIIYIADGSRKVFAYNRAGVRQPDLEFALDPENGSIAGLTTARGIRFYVGDWDDDLVRVHTITGERIPDEDFPLHEANADPGAMTAIGNRLYVADAFGGGMVDGQQRTIFVYSTGGRALEREFINTGNRPLYPAGIWGEGPNLWILDSGAVYHWAQPHAATRLGGLTVQAAPSERLPSASVRLGGLTVQAALAGLRRGQAEFVVDALISYLRRALPAAWDDTNRVQPADRRFALSTEEGYRPYTIQTLPVLTGRVYPVVSVAVLRYTQDDANFGGSENIWEYEVAIEVADNILINRRGDEVSSFLAAQSNPENLHRLVSRHAESIRDALEADYTVGGSFITTFVEEINLSGVITQDQSHVQAAALDVTVRSQHLAKGV